MCASHSQRATSNDLPLNHLYKDSGDAEAYGIAVVLSSYSRVVTIIFSSVVFDLLAKLNCSLQRKGTDLSRLPVILESILSERKHMKYHDAEWCSLVERNVALFESEHDIT